MLCRACQESESRAQPAVEDAGDDAGELCSRCGHLRAPEALVKRVRAKDSQLARFGLAGTRRALLDRRRRKDH
jgi:hypothetical protein